MRPLLTFFAVLGLLILLAVVAGLLPRLQREHAVQAAAVLDQAQKPVVNVAAAHRAKGNVPVDLPGDLQPLIESPIFARVDGYLAKRYVDYGDRVKAGQLMAEIETPELDQQIQQARATLSNAASSLKEAQADVTLAQANFKLAQQTAERWVALEKKGAVSHQETDEKRADLDVKKAQVDAAQAKVASARELVSADEANVARLQQMKAFSRIQAPFDGIVTARNVDVGTLINSGNGGPSKALFSLAQSGTMRIFVNVPQAYLSVARPGAAAELRVQELPGQVFQARVDRTSGEVDSNSRTLLTILVVPNPKGILVPGMYAQIRFAGAAPAAGSVLIPGEALVLTPQGTRVGIVDASHRVRFRDVKVGNDYGSDVEILSGIAAGDLVILNPTDAVKDGVEVETRRPA